MIKIAHLTSVHSRTDNRIFIKQCRSLVKHGYSVVLVVADGLGDEIKDKVKITDVGYRQSRLNRIFNITRRIFRKAVELDADIYHFHDPELIPIGLKLKRLEKKVVFDSHEDYPKQFLGKPYLNPLLLRLLSNIFSVYERYSCPQFNGIVAATPYIRDKFLKINSHCIDINNFPLLDLLETTTPWAEKLVEVCYVGSIAKIRGIGEIVRACEYLQTPVRLNIAGRFAESDLEKEVKSYPSWRYVNELGLLDRNGVGEVLNRSMVGLVTLYPVINYLDSLPVKMFEYMAAGIPVIASNFPLWRGIIETNDCGLCVDPFNPKAIAKAIDYLITNPERAQQMGKNGQHAVRKCYSWVVEEKKLLKFYDETLGACRGNSYASPFKN